MSQIPTPRPPDKLSITVIAAIVLLLTAGGEYYFLTTPQVAIGIQVVEESKAPEPPTEEHTELIGRISNPPQNHIPAGFSGIEEKLAQRVQLGIRRFFSAFGLYVRLGIVGLAVAMLFLQKAREGSATNRRKRPDARLVRRISWGVCGLISLGTYVLATIQNYSIDVIAVLYPTTVIILLLSSVVVGSLRAVLKRTAFGLGSEPKAQKTKYGLSFQTRDGGWVNIPNPFRGTLVFGGAGAGKTYSIGEPMVEQFIQNGMCGLIYDFKFPVLASAAQKAIVVAEQRHKSKRKSLLYRINSFLGRARPLTEVAQFRHHIINFSDMERTEKVNPILPENMPVISYAADASKTILKNLNPGSHRGGDDFFEASAGAYLTAIIWFYRQNFPQFCTLPHVVATAVYSNYKHVLSMLSTDTECVALIASLITAVQEKAGKQLAGVIATLQLALSTINSPEIVWVLSPDEERGEGFSLNLNDPKEPKLLTIGNDASLKATFSPLVALITGTALKLMNQQHKHPSFVFLDEAATIIIPDLETLPATARSNEVAMVYMTQDKSQMVDAMGTDKTEVLVSNLNNQLIGKVNSMPTAEYVSKMIGKQDKEMVSVSAGKSQGGATKGNHTNRSLSQSVSFQERSIIQPTDMISLEQGEFVGQTVETNQPFFRATFLRKEHPGKHPIRPFVQFSLALETAEPNSEKKLAEVFGQAQDSPPSKTDEKPANSQLSLLERRKLARQEAKRPTDPSVQKRIIDKNFELIQEDVYTVIHSFYNRLGAAEAPNNSYQY